MGRAFFGDELAPNPLRGDPIIDWIVADHD